MRHGMARPAAVLGESNESRRVVVTGLGIVSPSATTWRQLGGNITGRSGIGPVTLRRIALPRASRWCAISTPPFVSAKDAKKMDPFIHYGWPPR
jgi:3-oxoacyl-[acyl-carrier-protein] synthase II